MGNSQNDLLFIETEDDNLVHLGIMKGDRLLLLKGNTTDELDNSVVLVNYKNELIIRKAKIDNNIISLDGGMNTETILTTVDQCDIIGKVIKLVRNF